MPKGIQLKFDENGHPSIDKSNQNKEECLGGVMCEFCKTIESGKTIDMRCTFIVEDENRVFLLTACPKDKWRPIEFNQSVIANRLPIYKIHENSCAICGTTTMWRIKTIEDNWICTRCHPPRIDNIEIKEYKDIHHDNKG